MKPIHSENTDRLFEALLRLQTVEECYNFFEDLCTVKEIHDMSQRLAVAKMLDEGMIYDDIAALSGASSTTISRIKKCLDYGKNGYRHALDLAKAEATNSSEH